MKFWVFIISCFFLSLTSVSGQTLRYDVIKGRKNLGEMSITREVSGSVEEIKIKSEVTYRILLAVTIKYSMYEKFRNGRLVWGNAHSMVAGRTQKKSKIEKKGDKFILTLDGIENIWTESIPYSVSQIYFYEPKDGQKVFSQQFARFLTFQEVSPHKYLLSSPDGDNYYTYKNGVCVDVRVLRDFAKFNFVVNQSSLKKFRAQGGVPKR